jgi:hypothetical protein
MEEQNKRDEQTGSSGDEGNAPSSSAQSKTGDPGRTPGKAEGDEETAEQSLQNQQGGSQK